LPAFERGSLIEKGNPLDAEEKRTTVKSPRVKKHYVMKEVFTGRKGKKRAPLSTHGA